MKTTVTGSYCLPAKDHGGEYCIAVFRMDKHAASTPGWQTSLMFLTRFDSLSNLFFIAQHITSLFVLNQR